MRQTPSPKTKAPSAPLLRRFWREYLVHYRGWMILSLCLMAIEGSTLGALSYLLKPLFDQVFVAGNAGAIWWVGLGIFSLFIIRAVTSVSYRTVLARISQKSSTQMQIDLLRHLLGLESGFYQANPPGALIERVQGDTMAVQNVWSAIITGAGRDIVALIALFSVAVTMAPKWTFLALIGIPLLVVPTAMAQRYIRRKTKHMREQSGDRATRLDEVFHGISAVKLNRMEAYQMGRYQGIVKRIVRAEIKLIAIRSTIPAMIDIVTGLGFFLVLLVGGRDIIAGDKTVGEFMSFFSAMSLAFQPMRRLGNLTGVWQTAAANLTRIYELLDRPAAITSPAKPANMPEARTADLALRDVHLSYGDTKVLNGLTLTAKAGQMTALVGPSGAGKSTVFHLLTRLIDPDQGAVTLGGVPVTDLSLPDLRSAFSSVSQDALLFDETLRENILLGREDVDEAHLEQVLQVAHVTDFLPQLADGLNSPAGPRGSNLSGGQRQRVAIARALLRDAPILLLDEATSALDAQSERAVQTALDTLSRGRTSIVIAHRLSTIRDADQIIVLDQGRVVEQGTHDDLLAQNGAYSNLFKLQFGGDA